MKQIVFILIFLTGAAGLRGATSSTCPEALDQQLTIFDNGTWGADQWQSFTAGLTGKLTRIDLYKNGCETYSFTLSVYSGTGTGGALLYSNNYSFNTCSQWINLNIPYASAPNVVTGTIYTYRIQLLSSSSGSPLGFLSQTGNPYLNGQYFSNVYGGTTGWDMDFKTYVSLLNPPTINITSKTEASCFGYSDGTISTTTTGGTLPYTYSWSPMGQTTSGITNAAAGFHTVTVTDAAGCSSTDTATITEPGPVPANAGADQTICFGTSCTLSASGGVTYSWTPSSGLSSPSSSVTTASPLSTTTYAVTVTDVYGCFATDNVTVTVNNLPNVSLNAFSPVCVDLAPFTLTGGNPSGGTYSGPGVSAGTFDPFVAGAGVHTIVYTYTDLNGCTNSASQNITVNALPVVSLNAFSSVCIYEAPFILTGESPAGGTFSGPGVTGSNFNPAMAGAGSHTITYAYTDANGCTNEAAQPLIVDPQPTVNFTSLTPQCENVSSFALSGGSPAGGTYSGTAVTSNSFNPSVSGPGNFLIDYVFTDGNGCSDTAQQTQTIHPLPTVIINSNSAVCDGSTTISLAGSPAGGTFSGTGVTGGIFDPAISGAGIFTITYAFTDGNGCVNSDSYLQEVYPLPAVTFTTVSPFCIDAPVYLLTEGSPSGGTYSGPGISGSNFDPAIAGSGNHVIIYTYTDGNGCTNSASQTITVNALPTVTLSALPSACENDPAFNLYGGTPAGGTYSGTGVSGGSFDPVVAGAGLHNITYTFTDGNGCTNSAVNTVEVFSLTATLISSNPPVCEDAAAFALSGVPAGGVFTGTGVNSGSFEPVTSGPGSFTISYAFTDANGCTNTDSYLQVVNALPAVNFSALSPVCEDSPLFALTGGTPSGGNYSGTGVSSSSFDPALSGTGNHMILYTFTDANGCSNSDSAVQTVNVNPAVSLSGFSSVCEDNGVFALSGGTPAGGTYSGTGVSSNNFDPSVAGAGSHLITYSYTDVNGCTGDSSQNIQVNALPVLNFPALSPVCIDASPTTLNSATPAGGTYSGTGVSLSTFDPSVSGAGTFPITYAYTDGNGCSASIVQSQLVNDLPAVTQNPFSDVCINAFPFTLTGGSPSGGIYSGNGVSSNSFYPSSAGTGVTNIVYTYTDPNGCSNYDIETITVNSTPVIDAGTDQLICGNSSVTLSAAGGNTYLWSPATGLSSTLIANPVASPSTTTTYTLLGTDANGCTSSDQVTITVDNGTGITISGEQTVCAGSSVLLSVSGGDYYLWIGPGLSDSLVSNPLAEPDSTIYYYVEITTSSGCIFTDSTLVIVETGGNCELRTFNTFSPDGDGVNDSWRIANIESFPDNTVTILNRWGNKLIEFTDYDNEQVVWDGTVNGELLPTGTYFYIIQTENPSRSFSGWIFLTR